MVELDRFDEALLQKLQGDLPLSLDPWGDMGEELGLRREEVLERVQRLLNTGVLRRLGAILYHRDSGYKANGMLVVEIPDEVVQAAGEKLAKLPQVSHCYKRKTYPDWPYNLYGMIHGHTKEEVEAVVAKFVSEVSAVNYEILYSTEELKKTSMQYISHEK